MAGLNPQMLQQLLQSGAIGGGQGGPKPIAEFRAGRLFQRGTTVTADARKGRVVLAKSPEDGLLHFRWEARPSGQVEQDLMLFPGDAVWEKVPECTDGRVLLLRMGSSGSKHFYWLQEPKPDQDDELFKTVSDAIKSGGAAATTTASENDGDESSSGNATSASGTASGGLDQAALLAMLTGQQPPAQTPATNASASTETPVTPAPRSSSAAPAQLTQEQAQAAAQALAQALGGAAQQQQQLPPQPELKDIVNADALSSLIGDQAVLDELLPHLPEGQRTQQALQEQLRSPQLQQTLGRLESVLNSGHMSELCQQLGLDVSGGAQIGVEAFLRAVQAQADKESGDSTDADVDMKDA